MALIHGEKQAEAAATQPPSFASRTRANTIRQLRKCTTRQNTADGVATGPNNRSSAQVTHSAVARHLYSASANRVCCPSHEPYNRASPICR